MFTAYLRQMDGTVAILDRVEALLPYCKREDHLFWADFHGDAVEELAPLQEALGLDRSALDDCTAGEQRPRIDEFDDHIFLLLYGMMGEDDPPVFAPRKLSAFCGSRYLITVHTEPLASVQAVLNRCRRNPQGTFRNGPDTLLYLIADGIVDRHLLIAERLESRIEALEDASLQTNVDDTILLPCGALRKEVLELRSFAVAQRELVIPLSHGQYDYISKTLEQRFAHVRDHLSQVIDVTERLREQLHAVRENYHSALAHRTNEVMKTLTLAATIMLPLSLVAGIYGMNVPLWPNPEEPLSFWIVLGIMGILAAGLVYHFRRRHWL